MKQLAVLSFLFALMLEHPVSAADPTLVSASLYTFTHKDGDDKDKDTGIFVTFTKPDGTLIAKGENQEATTKYQDNEHHEFQLTQANTALTKSQCSVISVSIGILARGSQGFTLKYKGTPIVNVPGGNDQWNFDSKVILKFSDGSKIVEEPAHKKLELKSNGGAYAHVEYEYRP